MQIPVAEAMVNAANRLGRELITVSLDFDERFFRIGYGDLGAIESLRHAGIVVLSSPGLRTALVIVDKSGFIFTPTSLYLESKPSGRGGALNAIRMFDDQADYSTEHSKTRRQSRD